MFLEKHVRRSPIPTRSCSSTTSAPSTSMAALVGRLPGRRGRRRTVSADSLTVPARTAPAATGRPRAARRSSTTHIAPYADEWDRAGRVPEDGAAPDRRGRPVGAVPAGRGRRRRAAVMVDPRPRSTRRSAAAARPFAACSTVHTMVAWTVSRWGTPAQRERWLPGLAAGDVLGAFCLTEPEAGSDTAALPPRPRVPPRAGWLSRRQEVDHRRPAGRRVPGLRADRPRHGRVPGPRGRRRACRSDRSRTCSGPAPACWPRCGSTTSPSARTHWSAPTRACRRHGADRHARPRPVQRRLPAASASSRPAWTRAPPTPRRARSAGGRCATCS